MASSKEYLDFILDQLSGLREITYRGMMGEFILYYREKIVGGIYDDRFLVKPTKSALAKMPQAQKELPYEGAKELLLVDNVEDRDFLKELLTEMYDELPAPAKKKSKQDKKYTTDKTGKAGRQGKAVKPDKTLDYYNKNADGFVRGTLDVEFSETRDRFLKYVPKGACLLDLGCGSGRDTKAFLAIGYRVDAADGSKELCRIASAVTGIAVKQMLFGELDETAKYDGIWACSSILHLKKDELKDVFSRMIRALKQGGYIYTSFKYGDFEGFRNDRFFTDFKEESFAEFLKAFPGLSVAEEWVSGDVRPGRGSEKWLNLILARNKSAN